MYSMLDLNKTDGNDKVSLPSACSPGTRLSLVLPAGMHVTTFLCSAAVSCARRGVMMKRSARRWEDSQGSTVQMPRSNSARAENRR